MIVKDFLAPNHAATTFHKLGNLSSAPPHTMGTIEVKSFANEAAYLAGASHLWVDRYQFPLSGVTEPVGAYIENWLTDPASVQPDGGVMPFGGGIIVGDRMETLDNAKERVWTRIKYIRQTKLAEPFACAGHVYDADTANVTGSATKAFISLSMGLPYQEIYTLADNSTVTLDAQQMIAVGLALGDRNSQVYETARRLRAQIEAVAITPETTEAQAIATVSAITWPG